MTVQPKNRRLRFSLRTMLVVVTVACVFLASKVRQAERQREAVAWVKETGGEVCYDFEFDDARDSIGHSTIFGRFIPRAEAPGPKWLRETIGLDYFATVVFVVLGDVEVCDISSITSLQAVSFLSVDFGGTDLTPLAKMANLEWLMLSGRSINDLSPMGTLTKLKGLSLCCPSARDLSPLANLTELQDLDLRGTPATDVEVAELQYLCIGNYMQHYGVPIIDFEKPWDAEDVRPLMLHTWSNGVPPRSKPYTDMGGYYEYDIPLHPFMGLRCPNAPDEAHVDGQPFATYIGMAGLGTDAPSLQLSRPRAGAWAFERQTKLQDVTDGSLNTLLLFETARETGCWVAGGKPTVRGADTDSSVPYIVDWPGIGQVGGYHPDGSTAVFVDGRVGFLTTAIHPTVFEATCTISGNETDSSNR